MHRRGTYSKTYRFEHWDHRVENVLDASMLNAVVCAHVVSVAAITRAKSATTVLPKCAIYALVHCLQPANIVVGVAHNVHIELPTGVSDRCDRESARRRGTLSSTGLPAVLYCAGAGRATTLCVLLHEVTATSSKRQTTTDRRNERKSDDSSHHGSGDRRADGHRCGQHCSL